MKFSKKQVAQMEKAYSVCPVEFKNELKFIVGTEKKGPLNIFDKEGNLEEVIFEDFGGVMSIVPLPNEDESFLTTYKFYSPNDGYDAQILHVKKENGKWIKNTLVEIPFVHRFDILSNKNEHYLIVCTIKSGFEFRNDWNNPGKVYIAKLPDNIDEYNIDNQLKLEVLQDELTKNHGYSAVKEDINYALVTSVEGVFKVIPPIDNKKWEFKKILDQSTSDALLYDLDQDGKKELVTFSEFHGDHLDIYKEVEEDKFEKVYSYNKPLRFLHALYVEVINDRPILFIGQRGGDRSLFALEYDKKEDTYIRHDIDENVGVANVSGFFDNNTFKLCASHRETNQVCMYTLE